MHDAIAIALKAGAHRMRRFRRAAAAAVAREHRVRRERSRFDSFKVFSRPQHRIESGPGARRFAAGNEGNLACADARSETPCRNLFIFASRKKAAGSFAPGTSGKNQPPVAAGKIPLAVADGKKIHPVPLRENALYYFEKRIITLTWA
jgi:hypothetical protein